MAINSVNTINDAQNFVYLEDQSTILRVNETDDIKLKGINVIINKPKKGDVMCVTRYRDTGGNLLSANEQKIVWIDGLSINQKQLCEELETVGICVAINGNKAIVKYKTDDTSNNRVLSLSGTFAGGDAYSEPNIYFNNGFNNNQNGTKADGSPNEPKLAGCCKAMFYYQAQKAQARPSTNMPNIFQVPGRDFMPVRKDDFETNDYCAILRNNFNSYDEYLESMMVKVPYAKGNVGRFPSGKHITYAFGNPDFNATPYKTFNWAAGINVNGPNLGTGNWWIPSVAEMALIMRDITYGVPNEYNVPYFWDSVNIDNNTDIVNRVLYKLTDSNTNRTEWRMIDANKSAWTSSIYSGNNGPNGAFIYDAPTGAFHRGNVSVRYEAIAITTVEF